MSHWLIVFLILVVCGSLTTSNSWGREVATWDRQKRQTNNQVGGCVEYQFRCSDGTCIDDYLQCNGATDCPDGSDENFSACQYHYCPPFAFRCTYGGCIPGKKECNGHSDCADNSDELSLNCPGVKEFYSRAGNCGEGKFQCTNKQCVHEDEVCNGKRDCTDGSDETAEICSVHFCPSYAFRCAYGGCVPGKSRCNGMLDCEDGSDETEALCGRAPPTTTVAPRPTVVRPPGGCGIPAIENGRVISPVTNETYSPHQFAQNGERLVFTCQDTTLVGATEAYCFDGSLTAAPPRCAKGCSTLILDTLSVRATCADKQLKTMPCTEIVPPSTVARLVCKTGYKKPQGDSFEDTIYCLADGRWNHHIGRCDPICGEITIGTPFISGGRVTTISNAPWHVGIYEMQEKKYVQTCGGTIISQTAVLSAAHCLWDENINEKRSLESLAILAGKTSRDYYETETGMQIFEIIEIQVPPGYLGNINLFSGDIAVARLNAPIIYQTFIRPICIAYQKFAEKNVRQGISGRVAGWGLNENNENSPVLKVIDLEAVDYNTCAANAAKSFLPFILPDKFCASRLSESVCQGDSGGGFAEAVTREDGVVKYYLRGLVSVGSKIVDGVNACHANRTYTTFTNVLFYDDLFYQFTQV